VGKITRQCAGGVLLGITLAYFCTPQIAHGEVDTETRRELLREGVFLRSVPKDDQPGNTPIDLDTPVVSRGLGQQEAERNPQYSEALMAYFAKDYPRAMSLWRPLAEQGNASAQANVGWMYQQALGVAQDRALAFTWFVRAAKQDHSVAQNNLGACYEHGWGVALDYAVAAQWYRRSAEARYKYAQYNLAVLLFEGKGVEKNPKEARVWFERAAQQGVVQAERYLRVPLKFDQGMQR